MIVTTTEQLAELAAFYSTCPAFTWDTETVGEDRLNPLTNDVLWISFATEGRSDVIPMGHPNGEFLYWDKPLLAEGVRRKAKGLELRDPQDFSRDEKKWTPIFGPPPEQLSPAEVFRALQPVLFSRGLKIAHNAKFDLKSVAKYYKGRIPCTPIWDTMLGSFLLDPRKQTPHDLAAVAMRECGIKVEKGIGKQVERHSFEDVAKYALIDAEVTWKIAVALTHKIEALGRLEGVMALEMDVLTAVCYMELAGVSIDVDKLKPLDTKLRADIEAARGEVYRIAGRAFNLNSNQEKQRLLFMSKAEGGRGLRPNLRKKVCLTPAGLKAQRAGEEVEMRHYSVSAEALETMRGKDVLLDAMLVYADLNKLHSTYVVPYLGGEVVRTTNGKSRVEVKESLLYKGKIHGTFKQNGTETGRFSSSDPNLQNIPAPNDKDPKNYGKLIRGLFIAPAGYDLFQADYSQIEPRIIASLSGDETMLKGYLNGEDVYTAVGGRMGVGRKEGKTLVLAIAYGVGPEKIAQDIGCSIKEAQDLQAAFAKQFPAIGRHKSQVIRLARSQRPTPYVETVLGRRRYLPELRSSDRGMVSRAERQAYNTRIQGSAADIMKTALVRAHSCFEDEPEVNLVLTVHDELVGVCPNTMTTDVAELLRESMEGVYIREMKVPLKADVKIASNWGECK